MEALFSMHPIKLNFWFRISAFLMFLGVLLGAMAAHGPVHDHLAVHAVQDLWQTALFYHFFHALAMLFLSQSAEGWRSICTFFMAGILLFCGSLYVLSFIHLGPLAAITPLGGICFLVGWGWLCVQPVSSGSSSAKR